LVNETNGVKNVSYGIFSISENTSNPLATLMFTLNAAATTEINAQIQDKGLFGLQQRYGRARALDLGHDAHRLRRTWSRCAPPRGQTPGRA
jgi:hypothetical protein